MKRQVVKLKAYQEVGSSAGLVGITLERYVAYMTKRWKSEEELQCLTGYAKEWAERFMGGSEYTASDIFGVMVLKEIDSDRR